MIRPYDWRHLKALAAPPEYAEIINHPATRRTLDMLGVEELALTSVTEEKYEAVPGVTVDGRLVVAIFGAVVVDAVKPDECEVFIFPSAEYLRRNPVTLWKDLQHGIVKTKARFARIRALGSDTPLSRRFLSRLGFREEGPATRAGCDGKISWVLEGN